MKKTILIFTICLMTAGLLLGACATPAPAPTSATAPTPATTPSVDTPKYGGTLTLAFSTDIQGWDHAKYPPGYLNQLPLIYNGLVINDWSKGLAGSGEADWSTGAQKRIEYTVGELAESFNMPEQGTFIFHIRQGVHFALDPQNPASQLVGGREVTADDVVFSLKRHLESPTSFLATSEPQMAKSTTVTKIDNWTVQVKTPPSSVDPMWLMLPGREIWPPEVIEKYGDMTDWHNAVGTGPFMVEGYVSGSTLTLSKNPTYWQKDPVGPGKGNQLPYVDTLKILAMPDLSTQLAALRTGKVDQLSSLTRDDAVSLMKTNPELQYKKTLGGNVPVISMRTDKPELPFKDKRVRQALMMATDFQTIKKQLDAGDSEILAFPLAKIKGYDKAYMSLEELPKEVQALYSYNPDRAKELLKEAGYANGFKTSIVTWNNPEYVDYLSAVKDMWAKVGVELNIQPMEFGAYMGMALSKKYDEMLYAFYVQPGPYAQLFAFRGPSTFNRSWVNDPRVEETYNEILKYDLIDQAKVDQLHHDIMPYVLEQAWYIPRPAPYVYHFWWPWLKNYHGEIDLGYNASWPKFVWIDQDLKKQMQGAK